MSVLGGNPLLLGSAGNPTDPTFPVQRSVRLRSSASAYFNRTPASTTNRRTFTWSGWVKRGTLGADSNIFGASSDNFASNYFSIYFGSGNGIRIQNITAGSVNFDCSTPAVYRDPSAWYHVVVAIDTTQATSTERLKLWINGSQVTAFSPSTYPSLNFDTFVDSNSFAHALGRLSFDGYLTEVNFIDGQALTPASFGGYNSGTGVWEPRAYTGTYGTNGFYLNFQDNSGATATTIGKDSSGNSNNWTPNNISVTAGATYDSMVDVPTLTGETASNFATLNPVNSYATGISNANLKFADGAGAVYQAYSTISNPDIATYKFYCEVTVDASYGVGIAVDTKSGSNSNTDRTGVLSYYSNGQKYNGATGSAYGATFTANDIIGIAMGSGQVEFFKNGTSQGVAFTSLTGAYKFAVWAAGATGVGCNFNFGQRPFSYTPPTGFKSLNTYNLPDPTIPSGDDYHKVYTYTGNGGGLQVGEIQKPASLFNLDRSLRLRGSASASLSETSVAANRSQWTWSGWVKRGALGGGNIFGAGTGTNYCFIGFNSSNQLRVVDVQSSTVQFDGTTTAVFKDPVSWYHIVVRMDTAQTTASNRVQVWVNNILYSISAYPALNATPVMNAATTNYIGNFPSVTSGIDGYIADFYFVNAQALSPTDFGAYDGNFYWTPKAYTGTYGTNGFHLEFEDNSAATAAAIGKDTSGQVNNWTPTNISVTAGVTYDSMTDVPTLTSTDAANFAVLDPLQPSSAGLSNGNLTATYAAASVNFKQISTIPVSTGKWYFEGNLASFSVGNAGNNRMLIGFKNIDVDTAIAFGWDTNGSTMGLGYRYVVAGTSVANVRYNTTTPVSTDIFAIEYDADAGTANFYKNGTLMGSVSGLNLGTAEAMIWRDGTSNAATWHLNFGQRGFAYTPSTGYKAINSFNVAEVTGDLESPDFVWIKSRSAATGHALFNSVTGVGKYLSSNATTAETTDVNSLIQFNKNGFLLGNAAIVNTSAATYVASAWKSGATTVTNTNGTISAQVRASQTAGFSIVTYTGTGTNGATVGHGLGASPKFIIVKGRSGASLSWQVYHASLSANGGMYLDSTNAYGASAVFWNNTAPTSSVFSLGTATQVNRNADTYVAYCFSEIEGFSKFGSYTGNGSGDGPFLYCGFRPRFVMIKRSDGIGNWVIVDSSRNPINVVSTRLYPNATNADNPAVTADFTSNGFKVRDTGTGDCNFSGVAYVYLAFAENPFKYALAR